MIVIEGVGDFVVDGKIYLLEKGISCIILSGVFEWMV